MLLARRATSTTTSTFSRRLLSTAAPKKDTLRALAARKSLKGEVVLVRADLNLPLTKKDPVEITDATRLIEATKVCARLNAWDTPRRHTTVCSRVLRTA